MVKSFQLPLTGLTRLSSVYDSYAQRVLADKPSNYWRLNETSGLTAVDLVGGKNGTISGGVTLNQPGALADGTTAMTFDGTTGRVLTAANVAVLTPVTIEGWIKTTGGATLPMCSTPYVGGSEQWEMGLSAGKANYTLVNAAGVVVSGGTGIRILNDNQWHHVVFRVQSAAVDIYVDGVLDKTTATTFTVGGTATRPLDLGHYDNPVTWWNGNLDEVAIYPVALTAAQILAHYQARALPFLPGSYPYAVVQDGAANYWRLNEPSGATAVDLVGGASGTISGGVTLNAPGATADGDKAMSFPGTTGQQIITAINVSVPVAVSLEAWMKTTKRAASFMTALTTRAGGAGAFLFFGINSNVGFCFDGNIVAGGVRDIADGGWHHVVSVSNGITTLIYIDGALDSTTAMSRSTAGAGLAGIGYEVTAGREWLGSLDEVAIYPVALTPAQIAAHYTLGLSALALPVSAALDLPYRQLLLAPDPANPGPVTIGDASGTGVTLPAAPTTRYPYLALGPFDNGPLKLSHFYATGPGTLNILGVPY